MDRDGLEEKVMFKQKPKEMAEEACGWERSSQSHLGVAG